MNIQYLFLFVLLSVLALLIYIAVRLNWYRVDNEYRVAKARGAYAMVKCKGNKIVPIWVLKDGTESPRTPSTRAYQKFFPEKFKDFK